MQRAGVKDILSGLIFLVFGLAFVFAASGYEIGSAFRMGPGYFPIVLGSLLALLGAAILVKGLRETQPQEPIGLVPWRGAVMILGALIFFGATIRGLGLAPTLFVAALMSAFASRQNTVLAAVAIAVALTVGCLLIFHYGLGISVPVLGPWMR